MKLYEECRTLGLIVGGDDRTGIANIVELLMRGNEQQRLRYFTPSSTCVPDASWTHDVTKDLLAA